MKVSSSKKICRKKSFLIPNCDPNSFLFYLKFSHKIINIKKIFEKIEFKKKYFFVNLYSSAGKEEVVKFL